MSINKLFVVLIGLVVCVIVGALIINLLAPNAYTAVVDSIESMIFNATGMKFDFNNNNNTLGGTDFTNTNVGTDDGVEHSVKGMD